MHTNKLGRAFPFEEELHLTFRRHCIRSVIRITRQNENVSFQLDGIPHMIHLDGVNVFMT